MRALSRVRPVRLGGAAVAFAALTAFICPIAHYRMFTGFARYDDEGYMLMTLKSFLAHGWRYDVVVGYGPVYYQVWGAVFAAFGIPVDHDHGRAATIAAWLLASMLLGLVSWAMTGSIVLGLLTHICSFQALFTLVSEPMCSSGLIVVLLATLLLCACFIRSRPSRWPVALLGGAVMALIMIKVNVGVFALSAVALACVVCYPELAGRRWLRPLVEVGVVALPLLLMSAKMGESWARGYALHVCAAAFALVIALRARSVAYRDSRELAWFLGGFLAVALTVLVATVVAGTSPLWPIETINQALRFAALRPSLALSLPDWTCIPDLLAMAGAIGYWHLARRWGARAYPSQTGSLLIGALSVLTGLFMAFAVIVPITPFTWATTLSHAASFRWALLAFAWVALIDSPGRDATRTGFARLLLPPLAVLQALHAYPVAGSQVYFATLLLIPVGALCVANGLRWIAWTREGRRAWGGPPRVAAVVAGAALVVPVILYLTQEFGHMRAAYNDAVPLGLAGTERVRVSPDDAANYRAVVAAIDNNCHSVVMLPGMNSFYLWTRRYPPSGDVAPELPALWDDALQQRLIDAARPTDRLCLIENVPLTQWWAAGKPMPSGPLEHFLHHGFVPIATLGDYQILRREEDGQ